MNTGTAASEAHEDPAIRAFLALIESDIRAGKNLIGIRDELAKSMLATLQNHHQLNQDIEGDVAI
jgi:antitoxin PrlF